MNRIVFSALALAASTLQTSPLSASDLRDLVTDGKILFDARLRFEVADFEAFAEDARGLTLHSRFGVESGEVAGLSILAEGDVTQDLGVDQFNSTVNGLTDFPVIADPNSLRLNRLQARFTKIPDTEITVGRQRVIHGTARFIGNVGFRQNEQTFDALRVTNTSLPGLTVDYTYAIQVNRIFGSQSAIGRGANDSHFIRADYKTPIGTLTGYAYLLDIQDLVLQANQSYGARLSGSRNVRSVTFSYVAEGSYQTDFGSNPDEFSLAYLHGEAGIASGGWKAAVGVERLGGDGTRGFITPFATLHKFQGFADVFLATPAAGIRDLYGQLFYKTNIPILGSAAFSVRFHDFRAPVDGSDLGEEFDFTAQFTPAPKWVFRLKYGDFFGSRSLPSARRFFASISYQY